MCPAAVIVSQNGAAGQFFSITIQLDNIHVLNTCDQFPSANLRVGLCQPIVTHADGSLVSAAAPAAQGEEVVIYALGLGVTNPAVKTGDATPSPAPELGRPFFVQFDSRVNATPSPPYYNPLILAPFIPVPLFAGLTPGLAGLYQINLRIPSSLPNLMSCTGGRFKRPTTRSRRTSPSILAEPRPSMARLSASRLHSAVIARAGEGIFRILR